MPKISVPLILDHGVQETPKIQMTLPFGINGVPNVRGALNLKEGLHFLAQQMSTFERQTLEENPIPKGNLSNVSDKNSNPLITCIAHWYAVSLVNYLRFIALIEYTEKHNLNAEDLPKPEHAKFIKVHCDDYVDKLIPEIVLWRHKVGAHFAATDARPKKNDDRSMLSASLHGIPAWIDGRYFMGNNLNPNLNPIQHWSVTKTHEKLASRLWPEFTWQEQTCMSPRRHD